MTMRRRTEEVEERVKCHLERGGLNGGKTSECFYNHLGEMQRIADERRLPPIVREGQG